MVEDIKQNLVKDSKNLNDILNNKEKDEFEISMN